MNEERTFRSKGIVHNLIFSLLLFSFLDRIRGIRTLFHLLKMVRKESTGSRYNIDYYVLFRRSSNNLRLSEVTIVFVFGAHPLRECLNLLLSMDHYARTNHIAHFDAFLCTSRCLQRF